MHPTAEWHLNTKRLGKRVLIFDTLDSTSTFAMSAANDPANDGLIILARQQTAGRGQYGRSWLAPSGSSVLMSTLLFPPPALCRPALLTAWAAVSVCEMILQTTGLQAKIKWPNDVLIRGRKVCGILIEQNRGTVVGMGLNVNQTEEDFTKAELPEAGSLAIFAGSPLDCDTIAQKLIAQLDEEYDHLCQGDIGGLESCWKWRVGLLGKQVRVECHDAVHQGRLRDMTWESLELESGGAVLHIVPEKARHVAEVPARS